MERICEKLEVPFPFFWNLPLPLLKLIRYGYITVTGFISHVSPHWCRKQHYLQHVLLTCYCHHRLRILPYRSFFHYMFVDEVPLKCQLQILLRALTSKFIS